MEKQRAGSSRDWDESPRAKAERLSRCRWRTDRDEIDCSIITRAMGILYNILGLRNGVIGF